MNARIAPKKKLSSKQLEIINSYIEEEITKAREEDKQNWHAETARQLKIFTYALYLIEGYREVRIKRFLGNFQDFVCSKNVDEIFWDRVDDVLFDKLHLDDYFSRDNYEEREQAIRGNTKLRK